MRLLIRFEESRYSPETQTTEAEAAAAVASASAAAAAAEAEAKTEAEATTEAEAGAHTNEPCQLPQRGRATLGECIPERTHTRRAAAGS